MSRVVGRGVGCLVGFLVGVTVGSLLGVVGLPLGLFEGQLKPSVVGLPVWLSKVAEGSVTVGLAVVVVGIGVISVCSVWASPAGAPLGGFEETDGFSASVVGNPGI